MPRKWTTLALTLTALTVVAAGLTFADDDDSPIKKVMEKVNAKNNAIKKAVRTKVAFVKAQKDVVKNADDLIGLAKQSREMKESAEKQKKSFADWQKLCDDFIKKTEDFKEVAAKSGTTFDQAKKAYSTVAASCTACHNDFRVEDDK